MDPDISVKVEHTVEMSISWCHLDYFKCFLREHLIVDQSCHELVEPSLAIFNIDASFSTERRMSFSI